MMIPAERQFSIKKKQKQQRKKRNISFALIIQLS